jgi:hypothetical protein
MYFSIFRHQFTATFEFKKYVARTSNHPFLLTLSKSCFNTFPYIPHMHGPEVQNNSVEETLK